MWYGMPREGGRCQESLANKLTGRMFLQGGLRVERLPGAYAAQRRTGRDASHAVKVRNVIWKAPILELLCVAHNKSSAQHECQILSPTATAAGQCCSTLARAQM